MEIKSTRSFIALIPYGVMVVIFFVLLKSQLSHGCNSLSTLHFCMHNVALSLCDLFIPERFLGVFNLTVVTHVLAVLILIFGLLKSSPEYSIILRRTGLIILFCSILPMLILNNFRIATVGDDPINLLYSPSHRIYFASVGVAMMGGGVLRSIEALLRRHFPKYVSAGVTVVLFVGVVASASEVGKRNLMWKGAGEENRAAFDGLLAYQHRFAKGSQVVLVNFPGARGFSTPMLKLYCDSNDVNVLMAHTELGALEEPEVLERAEKSFLFVYGGDHRVYDFSALFRMKLSSNILAVKGGYGEAYIDRCKTITAVLNRQIAGLVHE
jgi:hypothetical protein